MTQIFSAHSSQDDTFVREPRAALADPDQGGGRRTQKEQSRHSLDVP